MSPGNATSQDFTEEMILKTNQCSVLRHFGAANLPPPPPCPVLLWRVTVPRYPLEGVGNGTVTVHEHWTSCLLCAGLSGANPA